ncbi:hypothetical protein M2444_004772 [Paenibacillus sp. PastF-3]|uniref:hypothetical protein n=1 Tax=Paenibacillus sp. PastF-3 TaxID=2940626 RepID=UPI00247590DE|nr:hypothetical protein [Paenibacillus sp. PastF-3]MDH6372943.1 hypothetical protein [Paenibacillus sp. PastF-3]
MTKKQMYLRKCAALSLAIILVFLPLNGTSVFKTSGKAMAAATKVLAQSVEVNVDGVISTETQGPSTLFVTVFDVSKNKTVIRQEAGKNGKNIFKGLVPGEYIVRGESYDGTTKATQKTEGRSIVITNDMFFPITPSGLSLGAELSKDSVKLTAYANPIPGDETVIYFRLYKPNGGLIKEVKVTDKNNQYFSSTFSLKRNEIAKEKYKVTAQAVKYGNISQEISELIEVSNVKEDPKPIEPSITSLTVNVKGYAEITSDVATKSNFYYVYNSSGVQIQKKGFNLKDKNKIITDELPAGNYKVLIESIHDTWKTTSRSKALSFTVTATQAAPPIAGIGNNKVSVGLFREYKADQVIIKAALPFYSKEGKYLVKVMDPSGIEIARGYTKESNDLALAQIKIPATSVVKSGNYTFNILGEKFNVQSNLFSMQLNVEAPLGELYWSAATQK